MPGARGHAANERRDGALAVGAGDADNRRIDRAREQLHVADDVEAATARFDEERVCKRNARRYDHAHRVVEQLRVEAAEAHGIDASSACSFASSGGFSRVSVTATRQPCVCR